MLSMFIHHNNLDLRLVNIKDQNTLFSCCQCPYITTRVVKEPPNIQSNNEVHQLSKDSGSESEQETWSFDKAINEVFRLLPEEMCPRPSEDHTPSRPPSGIEQLVESGSASVQILPQSQIQNTAKYIQNKLYKDKLGQDWTCPQQLL